MTRASNAGHTDREPPTESGRLRLLGTSWGWGASCWGWSTSWGWGASYR